MNILCDFIGHADLYYSMHALFSTRLGWNLFRPLAGSVPDSSGNTIFDDEWAKHGVITLHLADPSWPYRHDGDEFRPYIPTHEYEQRCITFDKFLSIKFDAIISTSYQHEARPRNPCYLERSFKYQCPRCHAFSMEPPDLREMLWD